MFSSTVIYLELFIALFFLPGLFITVILGIKKFRFLLSFALSYSLLVLTLLPFEYYAQPVSRWSAWVLFEWGVLAFLAVAKTFMYRNNNQSRQQSAVATKPVAAPLCWGVGKLIRSLLNPRLIVPLVLAVIICSYLTYVGPYLEIPADAWNHVFWFQWQKLNVIDNGAFRPDLSWVNLLLHPVNWYGGYKLWYFMHDWLCHVSDLAIMDSLHVLTFVNVLIFLLAIYYFCRFLIADLRISAFKKMMMAAMASLFAGATMGNMVFAYIRYYAFAPTILNYVIFLAAMAVIIDWLRSAPWMGNALWIVPLLIITAALIHTQEALFIFFMTLALSLVGTIRVFRRKIMCGNFNLGRAEQPVPPLVSVGQGCPTLPKEKNAVLPPNLHRTAEPSGCRNHYSVRDWKTMILAAVLLIVFFAGFAAIRHFKPGSWVSTNMIMPNVGLPAEPVSLIFRNLLITPPENPWLRLAAYQLFIFYQVVGCWGLFVYLLFALMIRHFVKTPYLMAGMIIVPLLTTFNPLTVDMMVRMGQDPAIYRFYYLIPLPFVGGYLFVLFWDKARACLRGMLSSATGSFLSIRRRWAGLDFIGSGLVLAGLIGLIFPINAAGIYAPYSKVYTLRRIPAANDCRLYDDLEKVIAKYKNKVILSDGWTAGFLWYYAPKNTYGWLTWLNSVNPEKDRPAPYTWEDLRGRGLIVVNCRDGAPSITGRIAKHWPEDVLNVSRGYSIEAKNYLESHPDQFLKIWSQNQIAVYAVR